MPGPHHDASPQRGAEDRLPHRVVLGNRLRELRKARGMTQQGLAQAAGVDRSYLAEVETGLHSISIDKVVALARALGVEVNEFFSGM